MVLRKLKLAGVFGALVLAGCEPGAVGGTQAFVVTAMGDLSLAENRYLTPASDPSHWEKYTGDLAKLTTGQANFANLEAVVTPVSLGEGRDKSFTFQMHTSGLEHFSETLGLNIFATANNHSGDFGRVGQVATLAALNALEAPTLHHGLGTAEDLAKAAEGSLGGVKVGFASLGIPTGSPRPSGDKPGQWNIRSHQAWTKTLAALSDSEASFKLLSLHEGIERQQQPEAGTQARYRAAIETSDIDLLVAHHPHVPRGLEKDSKGRVIAYGLGNAMLHGARNQDGNPLASDFGLVLRLYYQRSGSGGLSLEALEAIPIKGTHQKPRILGQAASAQRVEALNRLSRQAAGRAALVLKPHKDTGFGLWCVDEPMTEEAKTLCAQFAEPSDTDEE